MPTKDCLTAEPVSWCTLASTDALLRELSNALIVPMKVNNERLNRIYDKTRGKCHLCHKQLAFINYGVFGARGTWEIEHSKPKSRGGTDHLNNLFAACIVCNRQKNNGTNYSVRSKHGVKKAPLSKEARKKEVFKNTATSIVVGATIGRMFGPGGMLIGGALGAIIGSEKETDE